MKNERVVYNAKLLHRCRGGSDLPNKVLLKILLLIAWKENHCATLISYVPKRFPCWRTTIIQYSTASCPDGFYLICLELARVQRYLHRKAREKQFWDQQLHLLLCWIQVGYTFLTMLELFTDFWNILFKTCLLPPLITLYVSIADVSRVVVGGREGFNLILQLKFLARPPLPR